MGTAKAQSPGPGNLHSLGGRGDPLEPVSDRYEGTNEKPCLKENAAFACPGAYEYPEDEGIPYATRIKADGDPCRKTGRRMTRPAGRPPERPRVFFRDFSCRAGSWNRSRRAAAEVERHPGGLFPRIGFIAADLQGKPGNAVGFCNKRGVADSWIKEGKYALARSRLFRTRFSSSRARLSLFVPACNLGKVVKSTRRGGDMGNAGTIRHGCGHMGKHRSIPGRKSPSA